MRTVIGAVVFVVASALAFTLAFGENPLSRLFPQSTPFPLEPTTVTTTVDMATSPLEIASAMTVVDTTRAEALGYAEEGYACPLGGH